MTKKKSVPQDESVQHGGFSGINIPEEVRSQTAGSLPYDHTDALESPARSGLKKKGK
jgi:hypothetical protein